MENGLPAGEASKEPTAPSAGSDRELALKLYTSFNPSYDDYLTDEAQEENIQMIVDLIRKVRTESPGVPGTANANDPAIPNAPEVTK